MERHHSGLTKQQKIAVCADIANGVATVAQMAKKIGVTPGAIYGWRNYYGGEMTNGTNASTAASNGSNGMSDERSSANGQPQPESDPRQLEIRPLISARPTAPSNVIQSLREENAYLRAALADAIVDGRRLKDQLDRRHAGLA